MHRYSLIVATLLLLFSQWTFAAYRIGVSIARVDDNFMTYVRTGLETAAKQQDVQIQFEDAQGDVVRQLNRLGGDQARRAHRLGVPGPQSPGDSSGTSGGADDQGRAD
jgi:ABC-type sugar transport system substrate-binding protein